MIEKITVDMLPEEGGRLIKVFFITDFPEGATMEELKNSGHRYLRNIYNYFKKKEEAENGSGNIVL